ncbi:MAG TPA: hypothetical protein VGP79_00770 [Bryobacteraceae bacterium]|nr:hypothetical protein [Bryobacteraceae bacterium]
MTKVTLHYDLTRPLNDADMEAVASAHSHYGIAHIRVAPSLDKLTVDYDASRMMLADVDAVLASRGLPINRPEIPV